MGLAYYEENKNRLKAVTIDDGNDSNGKGPQMASSANVVAGTYQPLSRPLFVYVRKDAINRPEVKEFVKFYLTNGKDLVSEVGYVSLQDSVYSLAQKRFETGKTGSMFAGGSQVGVTLEQVMAKNVG